MPLGPAFPPVQNLVPHAPSERCAPPPPRMTCGCVMWGAAAVSLRGEQTHAQPQENGKLVKGRDCIPPVRKQTIGEVFGVEMFKRSEKL